MDAIFLRELDTTTLKARLKLHAPSYRLVSLAAYGHPDSPKFAAIWHKSTGHPKQALLLDCSSDELPEVLETAALRAGMMPTIVTSNYGSFQAEEITAVRWHFVLEASNVPFSALNFVQSVPYDSFLNAVWSGPTDTLPDYDVMSFDAIGLSFRKNVLFTALLYPKEKPSVARGMIATWLPKGASAGSFELDEITKGMRTGWCRPDIVVPAPFASQERLVVSAWRDDVFTAWPVSMADPNYKGGAAVVGPFKMSQWATATAGISDSWIPWRVSVSGYGYHDPVCCIVYARALQPLGRSFVVVDARAANPPDRIGTVSLPAVKVGSFGSGAAHWGASPYERWEMRALAQRPAARVRRVAAALPTSDGTLPSERSLSLTLSSASPASDGQRVRGSLLALVGDGAAIPVGSGGGGGFPGPQGSGNLPQPGPVGFNRYEALDAWVRERLETRGARSAQLAVARGGRLVINRGYTNGELGYPVNQPRKHLMAPASVCKALTGMAAINRLMPENGDPAVLDTPVDEVLGLDTIANEDLKDSMHLTTLKQLLAMSAGWPAGFDINMVAAGGNGQLPLVAGDLLSFLRTAQGTFLTDPTGTYGNVYSSPSVVALSERLSVLFDQAQPVESAFVPRVLDWWALPPNKAVLRLDTPAQCQDFNMFPNHSSWAGGAWVEQPVGDPEFRAGVFAGYYAYDAAAGMFWMSAATLVRLLSGMDASARPAVPELLTTAQVQTLLDFPFGGASALFPVWDAADGSRALWMNGGGPGASALTGIYFPDSSATPNPQKPTTCIAYMENWNDPDTSAPAWNEAMLDAIKAMVEDIETQFGWQGDDLFPLG